MQPKVSIIVPVYNVEAYLRDCMDSLVNQTLSDIEIIAVNDGSPDNSINILNEYHEQYPEMVKVYTTENRGVSHARNYGLAHATGEYVIFIDSDDYAELDMCELLYTKAIADNNDLVLCKRYDITEKKGKIVRKKTGSLPVSQNFDIKKWPFELLTITPFPWDKLYKRSVISSHPFVEDMRFEDLLWIFSLVPKFENIGYIDAPLYQYRRTTSGFMNNFTEATLDIVKAFDRLKEEYQNAGLYDLFRDELEYLTVRHFYYRFSNFYKDSKHNGELHLKLQLIDDCLNFLDENYPNWQENHYLKYSSQPGLRQNYKTYFDRKHMTNYVRTKQFLPTPIMKGLTFASSLPAKFVKLKDKIKRFTFKKLKDKINKKIKRTKIYKLFHLPGRYTYAKYYEELSVDPNFILFESKHGDDLAGNMFRLILSTTREEYSNYRIGLVVNKSNKQKFATLLEKYGISNIEFIEIKTKAYYKALASAKYLITDTSFAPYYIKKDEQVYLNTWHGTPLKHMGRIVPDRQYGIGNVQRNFFIADYLLYQQEFSKNVFFDDYMLEDLFNGEVLLSGYPRNSAFYLSNRYNELRTELDLTDKQVIMYMPTWRGTLNKKENQKQVKEITNYLAYIDAELTDDQVFYVKLHTFVNSSINFEKFLHIKKFPSEYELYDFLNATDVLVTDYSSIMFDYACSKKKIILFTYDREDYLSTRGIYVDFDNLGLPTCDTVDELIAELKAAPVEYTDFYNTYCNYDSLQTVDNVLDTITGKTTSTLKTVSYSTENTNNTLIYVNRFSKSWAAKAIIPTLNGRDDDTHYYLTFKASKLQKVTNILSTLNRNIGYIPLDEQDCTTFWDKVIFKLTTITGLFTNKAFSCLDNYAKRELKRRFGNAKFKKLIIHSCSDRALIKVLTSMDVPKKIYCFSMFKPNRYKKSKNYKRLINQIIVLLANVDTIYTPMSMKELVDFSSLPSTTNVVFYDRPTYTFNEFLEEVM